MNKAAFFLVFYMLFPGNCSAINRNKDVNEVLMHKLLNNDLIDLRLRPVENPLDAVNVTIGFSLQVIESLDEKKQVITTRVEFYQSWYDFQLKWNPNDYGGIKVTNISPNLIWTPDLFLYNNVDDRFGRGRKLINAVLNYDGLVTLDVPAVFKTSCDLSIDKYPFDTQFCSIRIGSWSYPKSELNLVLKSDKVDLSHYVKNGEWELQAADLSKTEYVGSSSWDSAVIRLKIKRLSLYHAMYYIIPCAMIGLMTIIVFILPVNINERMTVGLTLLIALSFFFLLMAENLPAIAETIPIAAKYYTATTVLSAVAYFMTCIVLKCHFSNPLEGDAPKWVKVLVLGYIARIVFMTESQTDEKEDEDEQEDSKITDNQPAMQPAVTLPKRRSMTKEERRSNSVIKNSVRLRSLLDSRTAEWNQIAHVLNRFFMILYTSGFLLLSFFLLGSAFW